MKITTFSFWKPKSMLPSFIALSRAGNPMAKLSMKSRHRETPLPTPEPAPRVALRLEAAGRRLRIFGADERRALCPPYLARRETQGSACGADGGQSSVGRATTVDEFESREGGDRGARGPDGKTESPGN